MQPAVPSKYSKRTQWQQHPPSRNLSSLQLIYKWWDNSLFALCMQAAQIRTVAHPCKGQLCRIQQGFAAVGPAGTCLPIAELVPPLVPCWQVGMGRQAQLGQVQL